MCLLISCDCVVEKHGFVYNSRTEKPIPGAIIKVGNRAFTTDSLGFFDMNYITGSCNNLDLQVEKKDYITEHLKIELKKNEIVYTLGYL